MTVLPEIDGLLRQMVDRGASDLHLVAGSPIAMRINGALDNDPASGATTAEWLDGVFRKVSTDKQRSAFADELELDFAYVLDDGARFRVNASFQKGSVCLTFRHIRNTAPTVEELHLPQVCKDLVMKPRGLVMVTGPTGSGKSTTLTAMIEFVNQQERRRIVTIEDPIEFTYTGKNSIISQREVGSDTRSFSAALKHGLRQNPDIILVGEMRDPDTASAVLTAAETGHLILTTGHAPSADQTIDRIVDLFPPHQQGQVRSQLASVLEGVLAQILLPLLDAPGRVPAVEIMLATPAVRNLIREGRSFQLPNVIRTSSQVGMQTMDLALATLCSRRLISREVALAHARDTQEIESLLPAGPVRPKSPTL